jgi:hypothetical protein
VVRGPGYNCFGHWSRGWTTYRYRSKKARYVTLASGTG